MVTKGYQKYQASFLIRADSPLKSLSELKTMRLAVPDEDSITAWMVRATLRDAQLDPKAMNITYTVGSYLAQALQQQQSKDR